MLRKLEKKVLQVWECISFFANLWGVKEGERDQSPSVVTLYDNRSLEITTPFMTQKAASPPSKHFWLIDFLNRPTRRNSPINDLEKKRALKKRLRHFVSSRFMKKKEIKKSRSIKIKKVCCVTSFLIHAPPFHGPTFLNFWPNVECLTTFDQTWPNLTKLDQTWPNLTKIFGSLFLTDLMLMWL